MSEIKLEVGKTYRSRSGKEVRIIEKGGARYPYRGDNGEWYSENGRYLYYLGKSSRDLIEELPETRHSFDIPDGVKKITLDYFGNRIVVEMVPEKEPKPGDVLVNEQGSVYIFKEVLPYNVHKHYAWIGRFGALSTGGSCRIYPGRPATPEEAQPLWDALKKEGKRWNPEAMEVEDLPESDRIREWVERHFLEGHYTQDNISEVIETYLNYKEGKK